MPIFLAPVPIVHVQSMLDELKQGHTRFAFGSSAIDLFEREFSRNAEAEDIIAYIFATKTGLQRLRASSEVKIGIFVKARMCGWTWGDNRGGYPKDGRARRPFTVAQDDPMALFWEIDQIELLSARVPITGFRGANTAKCYENGFVPQGPLCVERVGS